MRPRSGNRRSRKKRTIYPPHANQEMRRDDRTTLPIDDSLPVKKATSPDSQQEQEPRQQQELVRLPEFSIRRPVNTHSAASEAWEDFLEDVAERNGHKGTTLALGDMAVEYVSSRSLTRMIAEKHSAKFSDPQRARRIMREFAKGFNMHMREMTQQAMDASFEVAYGPLNPQPKMVSAGTDLVLLHDSGSILTDTTLEDYYDERDMAEAEVVDWGHGDFKVGSIRKCGEVAMGFDLAENEQLEREYSGIRNYLRGEGLNTNLMTGDRPGSTFVFMPTLPFFSQDVPGSALTLTEAPGIVPLHPPAAKDIS